MQVSDRSTNNHTVIGGREDLDGKGLTLWELACGKDGVVEYCIDHPRFLL